jgi:hypothetical protein
VSPKSPYPVPLMAEAQRLHESGWTVREIQRLLARRGEQRVPSHTTIRMWTDPRYRDRQLALHREAHVRRASAQGMRSFKLAASSPEYQAACVRRLRAEGEPVAGIVRVCRVVFGGRWTRGRVLRLLEDES